MIPSSCFTRYAALPGIAVAVLLLAGCRPIAARLPIPTPLVLADAMNAPTPPQIVHFPADPAIIAPVATQPATPTPLPTLPPPTPMPEQIQGPVTVAIDAAVPEEWAAPLLSVLNQTAEVQTAAGLQPVHVLDQPENAGARVMLLPAAQASHALANRIFAVVAPFATVPDDVSFDELAQRWQKPSPAQTLFVTDDAAPLLGAIFGTRAPETAVVARGELLQALEETPGSLGILPFDQVDPLFKVLTIDGANVLSNQFRLAGYPLATALTVEGAGAGALRPLLAGLIQPATNRDPLKLTQVIMTGVTAMSRVTALRMDQKGYDYPAQVISGVLAAADITHVSNEVPFLDDCVADPTENNLILCSDTNYWETLAAIGTDIVGLSGNHVNDFGREGARRSLQWYRDHEIPIYGSGMTGDEACAPLLWEHNGNTFAFIAALAFDPPGAWATPDEPGACYYYTNKERILAMVGKLAEEVDVVSVELQHQETYEAYPIPLQIAEFRELREAGADIVTGVMSHVPQAQEPYGQSDAGGPGIISYGLGNLFFDQMWSWPTRTELAARHTIYAGKLLNTELLTMVLEDFAQPRWATLEERADILERIFSAAPARP